MKLSQLNIFRSFSKNGLQHVFLSLLGAGLLFWGITVQAEVRINAPGAEKALLNNIQSQLRISRESCDVERAHIERRFRTVEEETKQILRAFGYYHAEVTPILTFDQFLETSALEKLKGQADQLCWQVDLQIGLGERMVVGEVALEINGAAADDPAFQALRAELPLKSGDFLRHDHYEKIKLKLRQLAMERGYFDAKLTDSALRVDPETNIATIHLYFDSGTRYRFGALELEGQEPLNAEFVQRLGVLNSGQPFDTQQLAQLDRNLSSSGYFRKVEVQPKRQSTVGDQIPIGVSLEPMPRHVWRNGVGLSTDTGARASVGYTNRYLNQYGHRLESELQISPVESGLTARYKLPGYDPHQQNFEFGIDLAHEDTESSESDRATFSASQLIKRTHWDERRTVELTHEESEFEQGETARATLIVPGWNWERVEADDLLRTKRGYRINGKLQGAHSALLSDTSFLQVRGDAKWIHQLGNQSEKKSWGRVTARASVGATMGDAMEELPASFRFFAGGDNSVRGYEYKSLGPTDESGEVIGGRHLLVGSIEYEHPLWNEDWWGAAFADAGNAFDNDQFDPKVGYGVGVRWYSLLGRIRMDVAMPEDRKEDDWRLHFGLGTDL